MRCVENSHCRKTPGPAARRNRFALKVLVASVIVAGLSGLAIADSRGINFESSQGYVANASIQSQPNGNFPPVGWGGSFPPGFINPAIDQKIVDGPGRPSSFGGQSWRISNAYASGSFADMPFSPSLMNDAGETNAQNLTYSGGARQNHFEVQYSFTSADPVPSDNNSIVSSSPDRGDGARMSYIRLEDYAHGIEVHFSDYQDNKPRGHYGDPTTAAPGCEDTNDEFTDILVATVSRNKAHSVKLAIDFVDGPHNDVVKVYVDGALRHVGTTWEDYFRWCPESGGGTGTTTSDQSRTVDSMLFRVGGTPQPQNMFKGFFLDNLSYSSSRSRNECDEHHGHGDGDVEDGHGRHGHSHFDKDGCDKRDDDDVEHDDDHEGHHFKSTSVDSAAYSPADGGRMMTITGTGLDNGLPVGFTLVVVDQDDLAPATYSIILTNGYVFVGEFVSGIVNGQ